MITKTGKGYAVRAYWRDINGEKRSKYKSGFRTRAAAEAWEVETVQRGSRTVCADGISVKHLSEKWISALALQGRSLKTIGWYRGHLRRVNEHLGGALVAAVRRPHIQDMVDALTAEGASAYTVDGVYRTVRALFGYAAELGLIDVSPCARVKRPERTPKEKTIYTPEALSQLLSVLRDRGGVLYLPILLCVMLGLRRGEALGLRWCDVDFTTGELRIRGNLTSYHDPERGVVDIYKRVKTRYSDTAVVAPAVLLDELRRQWDQRLAADTLHYPGDVTVQGQREATALDPRDFVCLDEHSHVFHPGGLRGRLRHFQQEHGLPLCSVHELRHTYGTLLTEKGVDVAIVSKALRHSSVKITSDIYVSSTTAIRRKASQEMSDLLDFKP